MSHQAKPRGTEDTELPPLVAAFDHAADTYDTIVPFFSTFGRRLVEIAELSPGEKVIDVACGQGASALPAAEAVTETGSVTAIDLAPAMVRKLQGETRRRQLHHLNVFCMDAQCLDLSDSQFDVGLSAFGIFLVPSPDQAVAELLRVLRPGGRVVTSVPSGTNAEWDFFGPLVRQYLPNDEIGEEGPPKEDLVAVLQRVGFVDCKSFEEERDFMFRDLETWWSWMWSHGWRVVLERVPSESIPELKHAAFNHLAESGNELIWRQKANYVTAKVRSDMDMARPR